MSRGSLVGGGGAELLLPYSGDPPVSAPERPMRGLLGDDLITVGRWRPSSTSDSLLLPPAPSVVRSMPFSRQSWRRSRKRLRLLDDGGDETAATADAEDDAVVPSPPLAPADEGASPADCARDISLLPDELDEEGTESVVVADGAEAAAVDVVDEAAAVVVAAVTEALDVGVMMRPSSWL